MDEHEQRELQPPLPPVSSDPQFALWQRKLSTTAPVHNYDCSALDLTLSMSVGSPQSPQQKMSECNIRKIHMLKKHAAEQIRLAAEEKAYVEQVRELTRRELDLAEKEFTRARLIWERAREEVEKAERMKMAATKRIGSNCIEIACQVCMQGFQP